MTMADVLARVVRIEEAAALGDLAFVQRGLCDLETDLRRSLPKRGVTCSECGVRFDWPGQLNAHLRVSHPEAWLAA